MNKATIIVSALLIGIPTSFASAQELEAALQETVAPETTSILGKVVPLDADQVILDMANWSGALRFEEVAEHGSMVEEGQVIARLDPRAIEKRRLEIQLRLESTWTRNDIAQARAELAEQAASRSLHDTELALQDARDAHMHWQEFELDHQRANAELAAAYIQHSLDDAGDELAQLKAMYTEDELTDATEEIVLKRSIRNLERQHVAARLAGEMRDFTAKVRWARTSRDRRLAVERAEITLERLHRSTEVGRIERTLQALEREHSVHKLAMELEELTADLGQCVIKAPRSGMLLHGGARQYHPGAQAPRFERYSDVTQRKPLFTVANPQHLGVVFHLSEESLATIDIEQLTTATVVARPDASLSGAISVAPTKYAAYGNLPSNTLICVMQLGSSVQGLMPGMGVQVHCIQK